MQTPPKENIIFGLFMAVLATAIVWTVVKIADLKKVEEETEKIV